MSLDVIQKVSISKPESRIIMPENPSTFDLVTTEFPRLLGPETGPDNSTGRNMPTSLKPGKKTFLPTKQQPYGGHGVGGPHMGSVGPASGKGINNAAKNTGHSYYEGYFSPGSFGSYQEVMDVLSRPVSSYSLLFEHPSVQKSKAKTNNKARAIPKSNPASKKPNRFPKNVKELTKNGMFDGVPVRYVYKSEEKLRGIIKGEVYLCGCDSCGYSKTYTADDLEGHADCKTSHANNHIRFVNGKTIHQVVKELQSTPDNMLFDVIQTVTGSPINHEAFCAWKESFQAAKFQKELY